MEGVVRGWEGKGTGDGGVEGLHGEGWGEDKGCVELGSVSLGFCVEDDRGLVEREEKGTERAYIDDYGLVSQYLTPVYPNTLHQDLPPAFGTLDFAPSPAIVPVRLSSTDSLPILR